MQSADGISVRDECRMHAWHAAQPGHSVTVRSCGRCQWSDFKSTCTKSKLPRHAPDVTITGIQCMVQLHIVMCDCPCEMQVKAQIPVRIHSQPC